MNVFDQLQRARPFAFGGSSSTFLGRVRVEGKQFMNDAGVFRPMFVSALSILRPDRSDADVRAFLDWTVATGFNGIRLFAGPLLWANQTAERARERLPFVLEETRARGLYVEVTALTDTAHVPTLDKRAHVEALAALCEANDHTFFELANEHEHPTQDADVHDANYLLRLYREVVRPRGVACAIGAPGGEPWDTLPKADYHTHHLDRDRDKWNMVRRVREFEELAGILDCPVLNNEPIGADEQDGSVTGKQRINDPAVFFTMGVLERLFDVGGGVHHSQAGLHAELPGPVQQACAEAYVRGATIIPIADRLAFENGHWAGSPVSTNLDHTVVRTYSGIAGNRAWSVLIGITGDPLLRVQNGWRGVGMLADYGGVRVVELAR